MADQAATLRRRMAARATVVCGPGAEVLAPLLARAARRIGSDPASQDTTIPGFRCGDICDAAPVLLLTRPDPLSLTATYVALKRRHAAKLPAPRLCVVDAPDEARAGLHCARLAVLTRRFLGFEPTLAGCLAPGMLSTGRDPAGASPRRDQAMRRRLRGLLLALKPGLRCSR